MNFTCHKIFNIFIILCFTILSGVSFGSSTAYAKQSKVLILPFQIHSDKDLSYLQMGIMDMLSTRLTVDEKVALVAPQFEFDSTSGKTDAPDQKSMIALGQKSDADYVLYGSLTVFLNSISTNAHFLDVQAEKSAVVFSRSGASHEDLISHISQLANQINSQVFARNTGSFQPQEQAGVKEKNDNPSRLHPDKLIGSQTGLNSIGSPLYQPNSGVNGEQNMWRRRFKYEIIGIAVGDINNNGQNETILISKNTVNVYRVVNQQIQKVAQWKNKGRHQYIHVDVADINKNGKAEIFVTSVDSSDAALISFVLEYDGKNLKEIQDHMTWYFRTIVHPGLGTILLGQKRDSESIFSPGIYLLSWRDENYKPEERMPLSKKINIYGFAFGDPLDIGDNIAVSYTKGDFLTIRDTSGKKLWTNSENSGGSDNYIKYSNGAPGPWEKEILHYYLPLPIYVMDIDNDNQYEVITIRNEQKMFSIFDRVRSFKHGAVEILAWNGHGLFPKLQTRKYPKLISDLAIVDLDNDGNLELVFSAIAENDAIISSDQSFLYTINIQSSLAKNKQ